MNKLGNYVTGRWIEGDGEGEILYDAVDGTPVAAATTRGLDFRAILQYGREAGTATLRRMTFQQRGRMLKALALHLLSRKETFYELSYRTGATRADSWIDIEGGIGNLFSNASLRRKLPDEPFALDGDPVALGKLGTFSAQHILVPREGVAIHINAYNFPVWGMLEKIAVNLLAGVAAVVKPASVTCYLTEAVVREIVASQILPEGSLQLLCGKTGDLLDHVTGQDVITFTGSASTGLLLKGHPVVLRENVPFNLEADSLNCIVLGSDVTPGMPEWELFIREVRREMTVKAGQKCTAIRRIFVPADRVGEAGEALAAALGRTAVGDPRLEKVRMGSLAGQVQRREVREQVQKLMGAAELVYGSPDTVAVVGADAEKGAFMSPVLLRNTRPFESSVIHEVEAFGPVSTIMPYRDTAEVVALSKKGKGSLCSSIVTASASVARDFVLGAGSHHGRILVLNAENAGESTGHGSPLPMLTHGGPGRAGGGEEMGGLRGIRHYMQRVAVQGSPTLLTSITRVYQPNARGHAGAVHPFRKYFEELEIGEQLVTAERIITAADIDRFSQISGDHFYAHLATTDFTGTMFEGQVAHGYFILSAAAGLFVDSYEKNPVLLNYGIDALRFTKPVYPGQGIHVRFTCQEKISQELRDPDPALPFTRGSDIPRGIVKWYVEILDDSTEPLAGVATILTMVKKKSAG